jgi:hypothetical protein
MSSWRWWDSAADDTHFVYRNIAGSPLESECQNDFSLNGPSFEKFIG